MREHLQDVVDLAVRQKPSASDNEIIRCLNYYVEFDDFLDLEPELASTAGTASVFGPDHALRLRRWLSRHAPSRLR
uniref:DUF7716 domain-containing protein n=1 Tax=Massilia sp. METH4 TaxID=3123041 RepID=UPI00403F616F